MRINFDKNYGGTMKSLYFTTTRYRVSIFRNMISIHTVDYIYVWKRWKLFPIKLTREKLCDELTRRGHAREVMDYRRDADVKEHGQ